MKLPRQSWSLGLTLNLIVIATLAIALILTGSTFYRVANRRAMNNFTQDMEVLADVVGSNCQAALLFHDAAAARQSLFTLRARPHILSAVIFDNHNAVFAVYHSGELSAEDRSTLEHGRRLARADTLVLVRPVRNTVGATIGAIRLTASLVHIRRRMHAFVWDFFLIGAVVLCLAAIASYCLLRIAVAPILRLARTANRIGQTSDYSIQAQPEPGKEISILVNSFNQMLRELRNRENQLQTSMARLRTVLAALPGRVYLMSRDGVVLDPLSLPGQEAKPTSQDIPLELGQLRQEVARANSEGRIISNICSVLVDGRQRYFEEYVAPLGTPESSPGAVVLTIDVTDRRELEERMRHTETLHAVGQLAGGIAHDYNNQLTVINGFCEMLLQELTDPSAIKKVETILRSAKHSAYLTRQILDFSRKGEYTEKLVDVHEIIKQTSAMLEVTLRGQAKVCCEMLAQRYHVIADHNELQRVFMNLGLNARDAMPADQCGLLVFRSHTKILSAEQADALAENLAAGAYLLVEVIDNGHGMEEATMRRIFEPFFTTKPVGKGTGMGLSGAIGTIRDVNGCITVRSTLGQGTTFGIYLPLAPDPDPNAPVASGADSKRFLRQQAAGEE